MRLWVSLTRFCECVSSQSVNQSFISRFRPALTPPLRRLWALRPAVRASAAPGLTQVLCVKLIRVHTIQRGSCAGSPDDFLPFYPHVPLAYT